MFAYTCVVFLPPLFLFLLLQSLALLPSFGLVAHVTIPGDF
jgi:hypothetical protein